MGKKLTTPTPEEVFSRMFDTAPAVQEQEVEAPQKPAKTEKAAGIAQKPKRAERKKAEQGLPKVSKHIYLSEEISRALDYRAAMDKTRKDMSSHVEAALEAYLKDELEFLRNAR